MRVHRHNGFQLGDDGAALFAGKTFRALRALSVFVLLDGLKNGLAALLAEHLEDAVRRQFVGFWHHRRKRWLTRGP